MLQDDFTGFEYPEDYQTHHLEELHGFPLAFEHEELEAFPQLTAYGHASLWGADSTLEPLDDSLLLSSAAIKSELPEDFNFDPMHVEASIDAFGGLFSNATSDNSEPTSPHSFFDDDDDDDDCDDDEEPLAPTKGKPVKRKSATDEPAAKRGKRAVSKPRGPRAGTSQLAGGSGSEEAKRRVHNMSERNRRGNMKALYQALRDSIPELAGNERPSNRTILSKAVDCIHEVQRLDREYEANMPLLREENRRLAAVAASFAARNGTAPPTLAPIENTCA